MKANIFLYPTNEPSQLYRIIGSNDLGKTTNDPFFTENMGGGTQNQYVVVISNDPIKVGDWTLMFDSVGNLFLGHEPQQYLGIKHGHHLNDGLRKIIFSNDPKLTSTGVHPINEEFLEWLVNNPTCKFIETDSNFNRGNGKTYHKIILPKEELIPPTKTTEDIKLIVEGAKQETLEEIAKIRQRELATAEIGIIPNFVDGFIEGVKYKDEQSYIEKDVVAMLIDCKNQFSGGSLEDYHSDSEVVEWFEKNKKKYGKCI